MISRFNLDQKRLNYYEDLEQFNKDFINISSSDNKIEFMIDNPMKVVEFGREGYNFISKEAEIKMNVQIRLQILKENMCFSNQVL